MAKRFWIAMTLVMLFACKSPFAVDDCEENGGTRCNGQCLPSCPDPNAGKACSADADCSGSDVCVPQFDLCQTGALTITSRSCAKGDWDQELYEGNLRYFEIRHACTTDDDCNDGIKGEACTPVVESCGPTVVDPSVDSGATIAHACTFTTQYQPEDASVED